MKSLKIAIMGIRGIPANYGGFEVFAEMLSTKLVERGHSVTVYCRKKFFTLDKKEYKGVKLVVLPSLAFKHLDTLSHSFLSTIHALFKKYDVVLFCNSANVIFIPILKFSKAKTFLNVDGIEAKRKKWNFLGKFFYKMCEKLATFLPDVLITDANCIKKYYKRRYGKESVMIPYGASFERKDPGEVLETFDLKKGEYFLYVSRFEPENNPDLVIKAFLKSGIDSKKLVMVGDNPYDREYVKKLKKLANGDVIFTGGIYGEGYRELISNCFCYIQATEVGGTHPALIENMAVGNIIIANKTIENYEVAHGCVLFYRRNSLENLSEKMRYVLKYYSALEDLRNKSVERIRKFYTWEKIVNSYENMFYEVVERGN